MADTLREQLAKRKKMLDNPGAAEQTAPTGNTQKKKKPKKKPVEQRSVGRDHSEENRKRLVAGLRKRIDAAKRGGNMELAAELEGRIKALNEM